MKFGIGGNGRRFVMLNKSGSKKTGYIHRMVGEAFVPGEMPGLNVLHNNGDHLDNVWTNLRWGTQSENQFDSVKHGTHPWAKREECSAGHEYTEENTYYAPGYPNSRICRICRSINDKAHNLRQKLARMGNRVESGVSELTLSASAQNMTEGSLQ